MSRSRHAISTQRLKLEPIIPQHADETWPLLDDASLWRFFPALRPASLEALRQRYERRAREQPGDQVWENWACRIRATGRVAGEVQATIFSAEGVAYIAYMVYTPHQRRGFAREAAAGVIAHVHADHGVQRILAEMDVRNAASIGVVESLGFTCVEKRVCVERSSTPEQADEYLYELDLRRSPLRWETPTPQDTSRHPLQHGILSPPQ